MGGTHLPHTDTLIIRIAIVVDEFPSKYVQQKDEDQVTFLDRLFAYVPPKAGVRAEISSEVIFDIPYS